MTNLAHNLTEVAAACADRTALKRDELELSYEALDAASACAADLLRSLGVKPGDRIGLMLPNVPYFAIAYYGILRAGGVVVPMNVLLKERETGLYLSDSQATAVFAWHDCAVAAKAGADAAGADCILVEPGQFERLLAAYAPADRSVEPREAADTAVILYTSGTTGQPKGAQLTHGNLRANTEVATELLQLTGTGDVILGALPLFDSFGQTCGLNASIAAGGCLTLIPRFDAGHALLIIERDAVTIFQGGPTMYSAMLNHRDRHCTDTSSLVLCASGGAALPVEVLKGFEAAFGCKVLEGYDLSETSPIASFNHVGEIAGIDVDGYFFIVDRKKDLIIRDVEVACVTLSDSQRAVLRALADHLVPALARDEDPSGFWAAGGGALSADAGVAQALTALPPEQLRGVLALLDGLHVLGFATSSPRSREQLLRNVSLMGAAPAAGMSALSALTLAFAYAAPDPSTGLNPTWQAFGYPGPPQVDAAGAEPIATFTPTGDVDCDVIVVGSGAGGGLIAGVLAQAGHDVVVLEAGGSHNEADFSGLELPAFQQMFWRGGPTPTADFNVNLLAASTLGGGPTINWSNCLRTPDRVREQWARESGLEGVDGPDFDRNLDAVWRRLGVNDRCSDLNGPHERMRDGAAALGWSFKTASRNADPARYSPESAGHIGFGDRTGAKLDVRQTYLHDAVAAGARVIVGCRAEHVLVEGGVAAGVRTTSGLTVRSRRVVVACGSLESPALLLRSGVGGPAVGRHLHLHPTTAFMGFFPEEQRAWWGAPMSALVDEFADVEAGHGFLIESAQWAPSIIAGGMGRSSAREHKETMARLGNAAWLIGLQRDRGHGRVDIDVAGNAVVRYSLDDALDIRVAHQSIAAQIRIHAAAGADEIVPFAAVGARWRRGDDLEAFIAAMQRVPLRAGGFRLFSAHQMSSCRMGDDPTTSVANPWGELHDTPGVHIGDASALPSAAGVNPMISTMALAHRTAEAIAAAAPSVRRAA